MPVRLIAFDLDDTLLRDDLTVSLEDCSAVREAAARGMVILPASGRRLSAMRGALDAIAHTGPVISFNGAYACEYPGGEAIYQEFLPPSTCLAAVQAAREIGAYIQLYDKEDFLFDAPCAQSDLYSKAAGGGGTAVGELAAYIQRNGQPSQKMLIIEKDPDAIERARLALSAALGDTACLFYSKPHYLEITHPLATKGHAVQAVLSRYGIESRDMLAIGDGQNDIPMLRLAGIGVAMGNASKAVRDSADDVTATNMQSGVGAAIRRHALS